MHGRRAREVRAKIRVDNESRTRRTREPILLRFSRILLVSSCFFFFFFQRTCASSRDDRGRFSIACAMRHWKKHTATNVQRPTPRFQPVAERDGGIFRGAWQRAEGKKRERVIFLCRLRRVSLSFYFIFTRECDGRYAASIGRERARRE